MRSTVRQSIFIASPFIELHRYPIHPVPITNGWKLRRPLTVRGVYDYQATGEDEIDVKEGSMIQLTTGPRGGKNYGDGWWEGQCYRSVIFAFWGV